MFFNGVQAGLFDENTGDPKPVPDSNEQLELDDESDGQG